MTKTAEQLEQDLIDHACDQLAKKARQYVKGGMAPAEAASKAIRDTKALFPPDWRLGVQGGDDEDEVEVWEVDDKMMEPCASVVRETEDEAQGALVTAVKDRARADKDPKVRAIARWPDDDILDILAAAMPETESEAFRAVVARLPKKRR
jgi:hypothetical protein